MSVSTAARLIGLTATLGSAPLAHAANLMPAGALSDVCPTVDARDTIQTVRAGVARRLGPPIKEETLGTEYVLTFKQKDGSKLFVTLTRDNDTLAVSCDTGS